MSLLSRFRALHRGDSSIVGRRSSSRSPGHLPVPPQLEVGNSPAPGSNDTSLTQRYAQMAQDLRLSLPSACHWLNPENVDLIGERPVAAGEFANIHEAMYGGRKVVLKSYRCCVSFDVTQAATRLRNEVDVFTLLRHGGADVVPLVGVYSTGKHPFGLVYEYMDGLDLKQYLRNEPNAERLKLLVGIARSLDYMHNLDVVQGNLRAANILVGRDGVVHIAGLGNASSAGLAARTSTNRLSRGHARELTWPGTSQNPTEPTRPTKASDMYAFGVMAWEIITGRPPFSEMTEIVATYSMLNGARPPRPNHHEISDRVWYMIERCWHNTPSQRMSAGEAVNLLETELRHTPHSRTLTHAL